VGCIILPPTTDLAGQIFEVFRNVGKLHSFSAGAIVGKRKGIEEEKTPMNYLNIIVCTPGRLVQHFNETPNFDCSNLQVSRHLLCYNL
jgi:ATP-dependent RNA helicase DDX10/DBP4